MYHCHFQSALAWRKTNPELRRQLYMFRDTVRFAAAFTDSDDHTRQLEAALISGWQPLCNILLR